MRRRSDNMKQLVYLTILIPILFSCIKEDKEFNSYKYLQYKDYKDTIPHFIYYNREKVEILGDTLFIISIFDSINNFSDKNNISHIKDTLIYHLNKKDSIFYIEEDWKRKTELYLSDQRTISIEKKEFKINIFELVNPPIDGDDVYFVNDEMGILMIKNKSWSIKRKLETAEGIETEVLRQITDQLDQISI